MRGRRSLSVLPACSSALVTFSLSLAAVVATSVGAPAAFAAGEAAPAAYLTLLDQSFFLQPVHEPIREPVRNHLVALGAMQKVRGVWSPRRSERVSGQRTAYTWKADEGFTNGDALDLLDAELAKDPSLKELFSCTAVACGSSVQWANRIFRERLLYGTQVSQVYRAYELTRGDQSYRLLVYGAARTVERQYLRVELLQLDPTPP